MTNNNDNNIVPCDKSKSKGGINLLDLKDLAHRRNILFPAKISKRALCKLVNEGLRERQVSTGAPNLYLPVLTDLYDMQQRLGHGTFGEVWKAIEKRSGNAHTLKLLFNINDSEIKREVASLIELSHAGANGGCDENIVCYHSQFVAMHALGNEKPRKYQIVATEFIEGDTLTRWRKDWYAKNAQPPPVAFMRRVSKGLLNALSIAHALGIAHLDIKPANIIISKTHLVVIDFGISCTESRNLVRRDPSNKCGNTDGWGTDDYMSPQYVDECYAKNKACKSETRFGTDVWAAGLCLLSLAHNPDPVDKITIEFDETDAYLPWLKSRVWLPNVVYAADAKVSAVIDAALTVDQRKRPSAAQLLAML